MLQKLNIWFYECVHPWECSDTLQMQTLSGWPLTQISAIVCTSWRLRSMAVRNMPLISFILSKLVNPKQTAPHERRIFVEFNKVLNKIQLCLHILYIKTLTCHTDKVKIMKNFYDCRIYFNFSLSSLQQYHSLLLKNISLKEISPRSCLLFPKHSRAWTVKGKMWGSRGTE